MEDKELTLADLRKMSAEDLGALTDEEFEEALARRGSTTSEDEQQEGK